MFIRWLLSVVVFLSFGCGRIVVDGIVVCSGICAAVVVVLVVVGVA